MSNPKAACEDARSRLLRSARRSGGSPDTASCGRTASPDWMNTSKKSVMHEERRNTNMPAKSKFVKKSERELVTTHTFDAPRELVWKAWTDPKLIPKWWGPSRYSTIVDKRDVRPGGRWRFVQRDAEGNEFGFHGEYREVVPPKRLVGTFEYEGMPGHVLVETATFEEIRGKTKLTQSSLFQNAEDLEGMLASGMEEGAAETMERFTELVTEMQVTVTFEDQDGKTKLTLHHVGIPAGPDRDGANQGWNESLDKLAEMLAA